MYFKIMKYIKYEDSVNSFSQI